MAMLSLAVGLALILAPDKPAADPVSYWIDRAVTTGLQAGALNGASQRNVALVAIAMFVGGGLPWDAVRR